MMIVADKTKEYTDIEVIRKILNGETALFELLIRRNNPVLYRVGRSYNFSHEDTQDLMQDTFIDAFMNLSKFEGRASFRTWIIKIMLNNCYRKSHKSEYRNETAKEIRENAVPVFTNTSNDTNRIVMNIELGSVIEKALVRMPNDFRMVFSLRELNGMNVSETAEALNISEANVRVRLNRAKAMLRREIEKSYSPQEIFEFNLVYCDRMVEKVMRMIKDKSTAHHLP